MPDATNMPLPPRPDRDTGQPFPPHAPGYRGSDTAPEHDHDRETRLSAKPEPPEDRGPVLAWFEPSKTGLIRGFVIMAGIMIVGFAVISLAQGEGLAMLGSWIIWPFVLIGALLGANASYNDRVAAGADWLRVRRRWVDLYDLTTVKAWNLAGNSYVRLTDNHGRTIRTNVLALHTDRRIWDLTHNGILHSIINGATTSTLAMNALSIDPAIITFIRNQGPT